MVLPIYLIDCTDTTIAVAAGQGAVRAHFTSLSPFRKLPVGQATWPRVVLGAADFEPDLGDAALAEASRLERLAPDRSEGFALAALEYLFRSDYPRAASSWQAARERNPDLATLDELAQIRTHT